MPRWMQILRDTFANEIFFVQMVILYVGIAILCGLAVGAIVALTACAGSGFTACMEAEITGLF